MFVTRTGYPLREATLVRSRFARMTTRGLLLGLLLATSALGTATAQAAGGHRVLAQST